MATFFILYPKKSKFSLGGNDFAWGHVGGKLWVWGPGNPIHPCCLLPPYPLFNTVPGCSGTEGDACILLGESENPGEGWGPWATLAGEEGTGYLRNSWKGFEGEEYMLDGKKSVYTVPINKLKQQVPWKSSLCRYFYYVFFPFLLFICSLISASRAYLCARCGSIDMTVTNKARGDPLVGPR